MSNRVSFVFTGGGNLGKIAEKFGTSVGKFTRKFKKLDRQLDKSSRKFKKTSQRFSKGFKQMAVAALAFFGIREFAALGTKFQDAMADLSAITGAVGKDLDKLQDKAFSLGKAASTSGTEVATAFKLVASAKPELLENLDALAATTEQVLLLKNAAGLELEPAANITAQSLNIFGRGAEFANKFVNILAAGAKLGSSEIADTGEAMLIAGPAAKAAGLSFLQLNAALQTTAIGGIKGSRAGTALNTIFGRLRRQGFDFTKLGLGGVFEKIGNQLNKVTDSTARAQLEAKLFGEEHSKVGLALVDNFTHLDRFERVLKDTNIAQEQADTRLAPLSAKWRKLGTILSEKVIIFFQKMSPMLINIAGKLGDMFDEISESNIEVFAQELSLLISPLKLILDLAVMLGSVFKGVGTAIGEAVGQLTTGNFDKEVATGIGEAFSVGGKLFGVGEKTAPERGARSRSDVNINLRAPQGAIESVKQQTTGKTPGLNVGLSMAAAQ